MFPKRRCVDPPCDISKFAAAKASPGVVSVVTHDIPVEMCFKFSESYETVLPSMEVVMFASGIIIECKPKPNSTKYLSIVLAPARLFHRTNKLPLKKIRIDVFGESGELGKCKLLACDFHYNLAAIRIKSKSPLQTLTFKPVDDVLSINPTQHLQSFRLRRHSNSFKTLPYTQIICVHRNSYPPYLPSCSSGTFSSSCPKRSSCNELYELKDTSSPGSYGGPALNSLGETIGIVFANAMFLPSNIITRWWNHYKSFGKFYCPLLGVEVANLHDADLDFLSKFMTTFPNITTAVIVTKVKLDSSACSEIHPKDVIVKIDGQLVKSKLQFFEQIWDKAGKSVEINVLRVTDGKELNLSLVIEEASPEKFHQWPYPGWKRYG